jgi:hypothetical protein
MRPKLLPDGVMIRYESRREKLRVPVGWSLEVSRQYEIMVTGAVPVFAL